MEDLKVLGKVPKVGDRPSSLLTISLRVLMKTTRKCFTQIQK